MKNTLGIQIEEIVNISKQSLTEKNVIDDLMNFTFNKLIFNFKIFNHFPKGHIWCAESFQANTDHYKNDGEAFKLLMALSRNYLELVEEKEPFADHFAIDYGSKKLNSSLGQYLTPTSVAEALAGVTAPTLIPGKHISIGDMTGCGGGSLVLSALRYLHQRQPELLHLVNVFANDIDHRMSKMTAVQLLAPMMLHDIQLGGINIYHADIIKQYQDPTTLCFYVYSDKQNTEIFINKNN